MGLRVATDADKPAEPKTLIEAIESGTYLEVLEAQRREMVSVLKETKGPALAALHRQIGIASKEISQLRASAKQEADEDAEVADEAFDPKAV